MTGFIKSIYGSKGTSGSSNPAYIDEAGKDVYNRGVAVASQPYNPYTGQKVADLSTNQQKAGSLANAQVGRFDNTYGDINDYLKQSGQAYGQTYDPNSVNVSNVGTSANPQGISTNRFDQYDISGYIDPYVKSVLDPQIADIREEGAIDTNKMNARAANSGNFGGSRQALMDDLLKRRNDKRVDTATNTAYSQAFNKAGDLFSSDEARGLAAQGKQADVYGQDIRNQLEASLANQDKDISLGKYNEDNLSKAFDTNYGIFSDDATRSKNAASGLDSLVGTQSSVTNNILNALQSTGAIAQGNNQSKLTDLAASFTDNRDYQKQMVEWLSNLLKDNPSTKSIDAKAATPADNGIGNAIATGIQVAALSDIRAKTNVIKVGEKDGINIYEFNYTDQSERYRGVMAQEVEHIVGAVIEEDGFKKVDYSKLPVAFERVGV